MAVARRIDSETKPTTIPSMFQWMPSLVSGVCAAVAFAAGPAGLNAAESPRAVERAERLANEGTPAAQVAFGIRHETGDGVPQNATEASKWFRRAAEQGDAEGCFRLGWLYARGEGLPQDHAQAAQWYETAAKKGHALAQLSLGWLYFNGEGVARDAARAIDWFKRAADGGDPNAQYTLGVIYAGAYESVPKDPAAAARWFRLAAEQGMSSAQARLGSMYSAGDGVGADNAAAFFWLSIAAAQLPDGAFKTETMTARDRVGERLTNRERDEAEKRAASWRPGGK